MQTGGWRRPPAPTPQALSCLPQDPFVCPQLHTGRGSRDTKKGEDPPGEGRAQDLSPEFLAFSGSLRRRRGETRGDGRPEATQAQPGQLCSQGHTEGRAACGIVTPPRELWPQEPVVLWASGRCGRDLVSLAEGGQGFRAAHVGCGQGAGDGLRAQPWATWWQSQLSPSSAQSPPPPAG